MAATFEYSESNGVGEDVSDGIVRLDFGSTDDSNLAPSTNPVVAGTYSFEKYIRAKFTGIAGGEKISNMKFYKYSGVLSLTFIKCDANKAYTQPVETVSSVAAVDVPVTVGTALAIESTEINDDTVIDPAQGDYTGYTKYIVLQWQPTIVATPGPIAEQIFIFTYDEGV